MWSDKSRFLLATGLGLFLVFAAGSEARAANLNCGITTVSGTLDPGAKDDPVYNGRPLSEWLKRLRKAEGKEAEEAIDAIGALGPLASPAAALLEEMVAAPFKPVHAGIDSNDLIVTKLMDMQVRADAVDALAAIGEEAACSTNTLVHWALTLRVIPIDPERAASNDVFLSVLVVDVLERMRVVAAIKEFGDEALPAMAVLLNSGDGEKRKLAVAVLDDRALPVVLALLQSRDCDKRKLGFDILADMWPVVARTHLENLKQSFVCDAN